MIEPRRAPRFRLPGLFRAATTGFALVALPAPAIGVSGSATATPVTMASPSGATVDRARLLVSRVPVPAGPFQRGSSRGEDDERPVRNQVVAGFVIDRTEVTRVAYSLCLRAHRCRPVPSPLAWAPGLDGNLPVTGVSWFDARDFCGFAGGRLPTEAEWEKAARGTDGREYPWGAEALCDRANWGNFDGEGPCAGQNPGFPVAVGRYPAGASPYGAVDLAGNVWEWVSDRYDEDPKRRVVRGGSCCSYFVPPRASNRNAWAPEYRDADLGFRCVAAQS